MDPADMTTYTGAVIMALIVLAVGVYLSFQVIMIANQTKKKIKYMEAQLMLLSQIALNNGVSQEKVSEILTEAGKA